MATKKDSYDRLLDKLEEIDERLLGLETRIAVALDRAGKRISKKAKDLPIRTKVSIYGSGNASELDDIYTVIAHSRTCDDVVVVENGSGDISAENVDDLDIVES